MIEDAAHTVRIPGFPAKDDMLHGAEDRRGLRSDLIEKRGGEEEGRYLVFVQKRCQKAVGEQGITRDDDQLAAIEQGSPDFKRRCIEGDIGGMGDIPGLLSPSRTTGKISSPA